MDNINWSDFYLILKISVAIITVVTSIFGLIKFIDSRVAKKLEDPAFISSIVEKLHPYAIFNEKGNLLVDKGAMQFIEKITVLNSDETPTKITLEFEKHMPVAPIIQNLDADSCTIQEKREGNYNWVYDIDYHMYTPEAERKFKVEIVT